MEAAISRHRLVPVLLALALGLGAQPAIAKRRVLAPPGNSAIGQYVEVIPTASGPTPVSALQGGGGSGGRGGAGALPRSAAKALAARGAAGKAVAKLVRATAPSTGPSARRHSAAASARPAVRAGSARSAPSAAGSVLKALTGSSPSGGLGLLLPVLLALALVGGGLLALRRRHVT